jgi:hypothetical protein
VSWFFETVGISGDVSSNARVRGGSGILFSSSLSEVETRGDTTDDPTAIQKVSASFN